MEPIATSYGMVSDISAMEYYPDGSLKGVILNSAQPLTTPYGRLIPQYVNDTVRRKFIDSVSFYPNGNLRSLSLQQQTLIPTGLGPLPAELITFYKDGKLKRLFPLNGKLSGFWTEANEYDLATPMTFDFPFARFNCKVIGIYFYETGSVRSLTMWPQESIMADTVVGPIRVRTGFALDTEGRLVSLEPFQPTLVDTAIGRIAAYDVNAVGIHADANSLKFGPDGWVTSLLTSTDRIIVTDGAGQSRIFQPDVKPSRVFDGKMDITPLQIEIVGGKVRLGSVKDGFYESDLDRTRFQVENLPLKYRLACDECQE